VSDLCDRIAMINHGKLLIHDTTDKLMNATGGRTVKIKVLSEVPNAAIKDIASLPNVVNAEIDGRNISVRLNGHDAEQAALLREVTSMGLNVYSISNDNLESAYLDLIKESR